MSQLRSNASPATGAADWTESEGVQNPRIAHSLVALLRQKTYDANGESGSATPLWRWDPPARRPAEPHTRMKFQNSTEGFQSLIELALQMAKAVSADALMLLEEGGLDWDRLRIQVGDVKLLVACETQDQCDEATRAGFPAVLLTLADSPVHERLGQALLASVADDILKPGARVVALYSGFEADTIDSLSVINLGEHLERLTARDLQQLELRVPLDTLKTVVDLALEIGREGREGKPVGTIFVVGDHRKVLDHSRAAGFDPVKGYSRRERNLRDRRVREGIKEIAQLDGAIVVAADGTVSACCRILDAPATQIMLSKGLGARHWAAAAITRVTKAVTVAVSQSSGTVRIFQNGELILRIEPFRRPMKWKDFDFEPPEPVGQRA